MADVKRKGLPFDDKYIGEIESLFDAYMADPSFEERPFDDYFNLHASQPLKDEALRRKKEYAA